MGSSPPQSLSGKIAARLKVMSQMDISERRVPQDGRIKMRLSKTKAIDFRVNQCNVNARVGLDFAAALRSFLRQDPDVIMVGEIRDLETAQIAIKAAQTGHLVLSTLHTNSAPETITRMANMGVPSFNIATSVSLIIAQRPM